MDGTLGSQTALLLDGSGVEITSGEELAEIVRRAAPRPGWPVAVHAIGDRANREALDAFEATRERVGAARPAARGSSTRSCSRRRTSRASRSSASPRPSSSRHAPSDRDLAERIWAGTTDGAYAWRSLLDAGAVARERLRRADRGARSACRDPRRRPAHASTSARPWHAEQAVTVEEALRATCVAPAWLAGDERRRGRLLPGYLADLVVLDRDPVDVPAGGAAEVQVVATMVGGRWVHNPPPWETRAGTAGYAASCDCLTGVRTWSRELRLGGRRGAMTAPARRP